MNKHVPSRDIDDEVAEVTWEKGQLSAHGLIKPAPEYARSAAGTLECIIDQAKLLHNQLNQLPSVAAIDALVPTHRRQREDMASGIGSCDIGDSKKKKARLSDYTAINCTSMENTSFDHDSVCHSGRSLSQRGMAGEEDDKVTAGRTMRRTISTKRSTVATVHNESEKKRRDRINEKMRTLQKLVPNSSKTDKASMLDEVIEYLKQLQAQVQMMRGMGGIPPMMMPMGMQQFQMIMMAQMAKMGMGKGMGMGMIDMSSIGSTGPTGISPVIPTSAFVPTISGPWEPSVDRIQQPTGVIMPDPFSAFLPCPSQQQVTMDTYQRMATLYPQMFHQSQPTNPK